MMRKWNNMAAAFFFAVSVLCCGCGEKEGTILIGSAEDRGMENVLEESIPPDSGYDAGAEVSMIRVYVCGAVMSPGVVEISAGSRVEDALQAAGGFAPEAGRESVNLAEWVNDGQMVYFPTEEEAQDMKILEDQAMTGLININTADAATLCTLPGIGESRAADIIAYREANGGFESCEDIMKVSGIKTAMYEKICDMITVR